MKAESIKIINNFLKMLKYLITANIAIPQMPLWYLKLLLFNRISENTLKDKSDFATG